VGFGTIIRFDYTRNAFLRHGIAAKAWGSFAFGLGSFQFLVSLALNSLMLMDEVGVSARMIWHLSLL
jgi:hypothetical protein